MPAKKRGRSSSSTTNSKDVKWVYFVCFDEPFRPVLADRTLFKQFECHTAKLLEHQEPDCDVEGVPAWNITTGRAMFVAFIKSLANQEFIIPKDVSYHEAIKLFEYEGIALPGSAMAAEGTPGIDMPSMGLAMRKLEERPAQTMQHIVTLVANAMLEWPRLAFGIEANLRGSDPGFTCSSSRVWIRFAQRPFMERYGGDEMYHLAKNRPYWLVATLGSIGWCHYWVAKRGIVSSDVRDAHSFTKLARQGLEMDSTHYFISCKRDMPRTKRSENREILRHADRFASWVLSTVDDFGAVGHGTAASTIPSHVKYARASISMAERLVKETPNCSRLFNGDCADENDRRSTPERTLLEKTLKSRGAKVVRWKDFDEKDAPARPLVFPPSLLSKLHTDGPCVLIDFSDVFV